MPAPRVQACLPTFRVTGLATVSPDRTVPVTPCHISLKPRFHKKNSCRRQAFCGAATDRSASTRAPRWPNRPQKPGFSVILDHDSTKTRSDRWLSADPPRRARFASASGLWSGWRVWALPGARFAVAVAAIGGGFGRSVLRRARGSSDRGSSDGRKRCAERCGSTIRRRC